LQCAMAGLPTMPWDAPLEARLKASEMRAPRPRAASQTSEPEGASGRGGGRPAPPAERPSAGRPAPPAEMDARSWGGAAVGLGDRVRPRRQRSNATDDTSPQASTGSSEFAAGSSAAAGAFYRAERADTVAPEADDGWFVQQQSALENDLRRLQTNAASGHQQAVQRAKEAEARAEQSRRQMDDVRQRREAKQRLYEAQQAEQEQQQQRQQREFDVQVRGRPKPYRLVSAVVLHVAMCALPTALDGVMWRSAALCVDDATRVSAVEGGGGANDERGGEQAARRQSAQPQRGPQPFSRPAARPCSAATVPV
jgi:hypothetical protein